MWCDVCESVHAHRASKQTTEVVTEIGIVCLLLFVQHVACLVLRCKVKDVCGAIFSV